VHSAFVSLERDASERPSRKLTTTIFEIKDAKEIATYSTGITTQRT
jgi:hypothetical protein